ncbi:phospholipase D family protein [Paraferrimonas sedimenticola]|uniref:Phospholipase D family protein n=1 Tax=Paraferrimonas sedimenticola TaxID=375674 RepID=A0AA37RX10_9GAMM|nr:phospholipase D family protein [Paraferrimonas sedimenticola]GLP96825.1 phospholipase D family protein [Paraferrimonas sedimenticola]
MSRNWLTLLSCTLLFACSTLPPVQEKKQLVSLAPSNYGVLADTAQAVQAQWDSPKTGLLALADAEESLDVRLALIDSAVHSLDFQYFVWSTTPSGTLLLSRVLAAADRGVRIRLLVDDLYLASQSGISSQDIYYASFSAHPNIHMRIFNPGHFRTGTLGIAKNLAGSFDEFNPRMHNKLLVADGLFALVGGRNISDEYFGMAKEYNFLDMDLLFTGVAVADAAKGFDLYWGAERSYPAKQMAPANSLELEMFRLELSKYLDRVEPELLGHPLAPQTWNAWLAQLPQRMQPGLGWYLQDPPSSSPQPEQRIYQLMADSARMESLNYDSVWYLTAYLIPNTALIDELKRDIASGRKVRLLTNSLASTDHTAVSAQYAKFRDQLLNTGVELYEFNHYPAADVANLAHATQDSGFVSLHMKVGVFDDNYCYVGSLNLDPRAMDINTENGLGVESKSFCGGLREQVAPLFEGENAWRVGREDDGRLYWQNHQQKTYEQPARSASQRFVESLFKLLPLQNQF